MKRMVLAVLRFYRLVISAMLPTSCRFYPTCSAYSQEAIERYGVARGLRLTVHRISRCHPWCKGGYDPVP